MTYDAVVLAGGRSRRMGGLDKTQLIVGDRSLLELVIAATAGAARTIAVGPQQELSATVVWTCEEPSGAGPAAALAAALEHVSADVVVLLAADQPFLTREFLDELAASVEARAGVVPIDDEGQHQWLCSAWPTDMVRAVDWASMRSLREGLHALAFTIITSPSGAVAPWTDCDTPEELRAARELT